MSDREWFRTLRDGKEEVHVGRALKGRSVHSIFFPVARSIRGLSTEPSLVLRKLASKRRTLITSFATSRSDLARIWVSTGVWMAPWWPGTQ